jgi:peptide methionine sulfoxide reductase MsrB
MKKGTYISPLYTNYFVLAQIFSSSCGWQSFLNKIIKKSVVYKKDHSLGMERIEVLLQQMSRQSGHLF